MSANSPSSFFHRRVIGRASSPPTWACYEQIIDAFDDDDDYSSCDSFSEDGEDYRSRDDARSDSEDSAHCGHPADAHSDDNSDHHHDDARDMEVDENDEKKVAELHKNAKGKQRAVEPISESPKSRRSRRSRRHVETLRPILTIHRSQGFVWNQDLFVPPYIKDRYIASTSPPSLNGFVSGFNNSSNPTMNDYEVEVVEIRVREGELNDIIP